MSVSKTQQGYIKAENTLLIAFIALSIGFVGGVVFGVYKSGFTMTPQGAIPPVNSMNTDQMEKIETLKAQTLKTPEDTESWIQLGHLYFDANQTKEAISAYETALKLKPDNPDVLTDLGVMYRRAGDPKKAVAQFDQAMTVNPKHEVSRFNKGIVLMHDLNDSKGAIAAWQELIKINPEAKTPNGQLIKDFIEQLKKQGMQ